MKPVSSTPRNAVIGWLTAGLLWLYFLVPVFIPRQSFPWAMLLLIVVTGIVSTLLLLLRHRQPVLAVMVIAATLTVAPGALGAAFFAQASLARQGQRAVAALAAVWVVAAKVIGLLAGPWSSGWDGAASFELTVTIAGVVIATMAGWLSRSRADESQSRAAVETARHEAENARLEQARLSERERIAREMHDVLAHRLSLVAMHAGALAFRTDLDSETAREIASLIKANARQSLDELRLVLSDLRDGDGAPEPPQPSLVQLPVLIAEASEAGQQIVLARTVDGKKVPSTVSRQAYRVVQEALTNARKHAPGAPVTMSIEFVPDDSLSIRVSNPLTDLAPADESGSKLGLVGVSERAAGVGGSAHHECINDTFILEVTMPVSASQASASERTAPRAQETR